IVATLVDGEARIVPEIALDKVVREFGPFRIGAGARHRRAVVAVGRDGAGCERERERRKHGGEAAEGHMEPLPVFGWPQVLHPTHALASRFSTNDAWGAVGEAAVFRLNSAGSRAREP